MAYCLKCGAKLEDDDVVCPFCGGETGGRGSFRRLSDEITVDLRTLLHTEDETEGMDPYDVKENRGAAALSYLFLTIFVPLGLRRGSEFARFHGNQALTLLLSSMLFGGGALFAGWVLHFVPLVGEVLAALLLSLWGILTLCCMVFGMRAALSGKARALPVIGRFRLLK